MRTITAHRVGGRIRVPVVDRWQRARRSARSMRRRGVPDRVIALAIRIGAEDATARLDRLLGTWSLWR